jgi:light-regulated signal transduction histidine kinase (bacteriophytochrome)
VEIVNSNEVLKATLANLAGAIAESNAQIITGQLPSLPVNATHLQQLFQNLIGNAIKYRSPEIIPIVHVGAERQNAYWVFRVADNGIGIDSEYRENIFGLFKRLHNSNDEYSGTGIGLAICRRIVDRYHGRLWVESEPGQGSTFRFTLPV